MVTSRGALCECASSEGVSALRFKFYPLWGHAFIPTCILANARLILVEPKPLHSCADVRLRSLIQL